MRVPAFNVWQGAVLAALGDNTGPWRTQSYFARLCSIALITAECRFGLCSADPHAGSMHMLLWPHIAPCLDLRKQRLCSTYQFARVFNVCWLAAC